MLLGNVTPNTRHEIITAERHSRRCCMCRHHTHKRGVKQYIGPAFFFSVGRIKGACTHTAGTAACQQPSTTAYWEISKSSCAANGQRNTVNHTRKRLQHAMRNWGKRKLIGLSDVHNSVTTQCTCVRPARRAPQRHAPQGQAPSHAVWCCRSDKGTTCSGMPPGAPAMVGMTRALRATWGTTSTAKRKVLQARNKHLCERHCCQHEQGMHVYAYAYHVCSILCLFVSFF